MSSESEGYLAYMLRLWQAAGNDETAWRASLESPHTGERQGFSNLELLFAFLEEKTAGKSSSAQDPEQADPPMPGPDLDLDEGQSIST
jgi:hypothetical protein